MTDDRYVAVMEEGIARREMYLSRLWLLYDRSGERGRPAIVERIVDAEAALHRAEERLQSANAMRPTDCWADLQGWPHGHLSRGAAACRKKGCPAGGPVRPPENRS